MQLTSWVSKDGWDIVSTFREVSAMLRSNEENSGSPVVVKYWASKSQQRTGTEGKLPGERNV